MTWYDVGLFASTTFWSACLQPFPLLLLQVHQSESVLNSPSRRQGFTKGAESYGEAEQRSRPMILDTANTTLYKCPLSRTVVVTHWDWNSEGTLNRSASQVDRPVVIYIVVYQQLTSLSGQAELMCWLSRICVCIDNKIAYLIFSCNSLDRFTVKSRMIKPREMFP